MKYVLKVAVITLAAFWLTGCTAMRGLAGSDYLEANFPVVLNEEAPELDPNKAYISFVKSKDDRFHYSNGRSFYQHADDKTWVVGRTFNLKSRTMIPVDPGTHRFYISSCWPAAIEVHAEAGRIYYIAPTRARKPSFWAYCQGQAALKPFELTTESKALLNTLPVTTLEQEQKDNINQRIDMFNFNDKILNVLAKGDEVPEELRYVMTADQGVKF